MDAAANVVGLVAAAAAVEQEIAIQRNNLRLQRRQLRDTMDPFHLPEQRFIELFRLPREFTFDMVSGMEDYFVPGVRDTSMPYHLKALTTLNFLARGSYQRGIGQDFMHCMSQSSVSRAVNEGVRALEARYLDEYITFPITVEKKRNLKSRFYAECGLQGVLGSVDGSQIELQALSYDNEEFPEEVFVNKDGRHALNVQFVMSYDSEILAVNARFPGSNHDSFNWRSSQVRDHLKSEWENGHRNQWLLGDSAYPQEPWLMKPIPHPEPGSREEEYNRRHKRGRCSVERGIGLLKSWQRCLNRCRTLHYNPDTAAHIVNACSIIHNMALKTRMHQPDDLQLEEDNGQGEQGEGFLPGPAGLVNAGNEARQGLVAAMP